ncbi:MAG: hypothetical protein R3F26_00030 [Gammaproteobacteria bacterium]
MHSAETTPAASGPVPGILLGFLLLVTTALLAWQFTQQRPRVWTQPAVQSVSLGGQYYALDAHQLDELSRFTAAFFASRGDATRAQMEARIHAHLNSSFQRVRERLPVFADWYYSLPGEYSRLAMAALSTANLSEGDFVARRTAQLLFPDTVWRDGLTRLEQDADALLRSEYANTRAGWLREVETRLAAQRVPPPIAELSVNSPPLPLDALWQPFEALEGRVGMGERVTLSSMAAAGMAGSALWRVAMARNGLGSARIVAAGAARGGSRLGGAAAGAAVCAPGGPVALACALGAGVATWVATDWLLLEADEALNRQELLAHLDAGLQELQTGLEQELLAAYEAGLEGMHTASLQQIEESFSLVRER